MSFDKTTSMDVDCRSKRFKLASATFMLVDIATPTLIIEVSTAQLHVCTHRTHTCTYTYVPCTCHFDSWDWREGGTQDATMEIC
jgi:hypothetical protein